MVDLLAFGAHPDDVEIGAGGILAKHACKGYKTAICNLTEGDLSSNGDVNSRRIESMNAASILGVGEVINVKLSDRGLHESHVNHLVQVIRSLKPKVILAPHSKDRHPDHVVCNQLVKEAVFDASIRKKQVGDLASHRVEDVFFYLINDMDAPDLVMDVSEVYEKKTRALHAYISQFTRGKEDVDTPINDSQYLKMIESRDRLWGYQIGTDFGEALICSRTLRHDWLL